MPDPSVSQNVASFSVSIVAVQDVRVGQTIWAHNDSDWLKVCAVEINSYGDVILFRRDGSEASFAHGQKVLALLRTVLE